MGNGLNPQLEIKNLYKKYSNGVEAVKGVDFNIYPREVHALLGPNGAGKTTTIKSVLGFVQSTGEISVFGKNIDEVRNRIAFIPEEKNFYDNITAVQAAKMCEKIIPSFKRGKFDGYLKKFGLPLNKKIKSFSHGMKTSIYLAITFAQDVDLYIFDEPTWGLDPIKRDDVLQMIRDLLLEEKTVLYTSHIIPEVEQIADRISIMNNGKILFTGFLDDIKEKFRVIYIPENLGSLEELNEKAVIKEKEKTIVLSENKKTWEHFESMEGVSVEVPYLERFFQILIRGNSNVL